MKQEFTITIYTENQVGLLNRIAIIFSRRKINIEKQCISKNVKKTRDVCIIASKRKTTSGV
jgi:acetolactate synthase small subunit